MKKFKGIKVRHRRRRRLAAPKPELLFPDRDIVQQKTKKIEFSLFILGAFVIVIAIGSARSYLIKYTARGAYSNHILGTSSVLSTPTSQPTLTETPTTTPTPTPTVTPIPSPTAMPTSTPEPTSVPQSSILSQVGVPAGNINVLDVSTAYTGLPFAAPTEKKTLLRLDFDTTPCCGWQVDRSEGTEIIEGKIGNALMFKPGLFVLKGGEVFPYAGTLSFWLKLDEMLPDVDSSLLAWNFDGGKRVPSLFEILMFANRLHFITYDESTDQKIIKGVIDPPLDWHFVEVSWDLTKEPYKRNLFIDGRHVASGPFTFAPKENGPSIFQLGGKTEINNVSALFTIDEITLTNWAKSEEEITGAH